MLRDGSGAEALNAQGNALREAGDLHGAVASYSEALARAPDHAAALYNLGLALAELGEAAEAERAFRRLAELAPSDAEARVQLGALLLERGAFAEAQAVLECALRLAPGSPHAHYYLGLAHRAAGDLPAARAALESAVALDPGAAPARSALGLALLDEGRGAEAARELQQALDLAGPQAPLLNNLGAALMLAGRRTEALRALERALSMDPALAQAHLNIADHLIEQGDFAGASRQLAEGMRRAPQAAGFADRLLFAMQQCCDWSRFEELCRRRLEALRLRPEELTPPFSLLAIPSTPADQLACAAAIARRLEARAAASPLPPRSAAPRGDRLRVGYLSGDFCEHVMAYLLAGLFERHDRETLEVFAYSYGPDDGSALRARIARAAEHFVDIRDLTDRDAAARIRADCVDILVDLNGYTRGARSAIAAWRPAPLQVNFLGYPGTLGAGYMDYVIVDRFVYREEDTRHFAEQPVFMPGCYAPGDRDRRLGPVPPRTQLGLPEQGVVFCCFNQAFKILPGVYDVWMRLLRALEASVLWLLEANPEATRNLRSEAERRGVDPARIVFAPRVPPPEHLARIPAADLFLDTFPYNAHTTAADALWAGVPVITCPGDTFASRVAGSMVVSAGLADLITRSFEEYEALALRLAGAPAERAALRARLAEARVRAPLFDTAAYARHLETGFRRMHEIRLAGGPPRPIAV